MSGTGSELCSGAMQTVAGNVTNSIFSWISSNYEMHEALDQTLVSMKKMLISHKCAINAARERRITDPLLLDWLESLIDDVYLGEYIQWTFISRNSSSAMITNEDEGTSNSSLSLSNRARKRKRTVLKTIEMVLFGDADLKELDKVRRYLLGNDLMLFMKMVDDQPKIDRPIRNYLYMDHNRLVGREKEREEIMEFLFKPKGADEENVDILPIIGYPGVGATSLALHCYNDPKVQNHFSERYFFPRFIFCPKSFIPSSERFLLIIDNFHRNWEGTFWEEDWECIRCGKEGSKVILIAKFDEYEGLKEVINIERFKPMMIDSISEEEYLRFFKEHAFGTADPQDFPQLANIAREIAEKMNGFMWGALIVGELLRDKLSTRLWTKVRDAILGSESSFWGWGEVVETIFQLWSKFLILVSVVFYHENGPGNVGPSLRELMALGPCRYKPDIVGEVYCGIQFEVAKSLFEGNRGVVVAYCKPFGDERRLLWEDPGQQEHYLTRWYSARGNPIPNRTRYALKHVVP